MKQQEVDLPEPSASTTALGNTMLYVGYAQPTGFIVDL